MGARSISRHRQHNRGRLSKKALDLTFNGDNLVLIGVISTRGGLLLFLHSGVLIGNPVELSFG